MFSHKNDVVLSDHAALATNFRKGQNKGQRHRYHQRRLYLQRTEVPPA